MDATSLKSAATYICGCQGGCGALDNLWWHPLTALNTSASHLHELTQLSKKTQSPLFGYIALRQKTSLMAAGPSIPTLTTPIVARAMRHNMTSSTTATPQTGFWHMAPLSAAQALMTSANLASVLFVSTCLQNNKAWQWTNES